VRADHIAVALDGDALVPRPSSPRSARTVVPSTTVRALPLITTSMLVDIGAEPTTVDAASHANAVVTTTTSMAW